MRTQRSIVLIMNFLFIMIVFMTFAILWRVLYQDVIRFYAKGYTLLSLVFITIFVILMALYGGFKIGISRIFDMLFSSAISLFLTLIVTYFQVSLIARYLVNPMGFMFIFIIQLILGFILICVEHHLFFKFFPPRKCIAIMNDDTMVVRKLERHHRKNMTIDQTVTFDEFLQNSIDVKDYDCVIVESLSEKEKIVISQLCYENNVVLYVVPTFYEVLIRCSKDTHFIDTPIFQENNYGPSQFSKIFKRTFDILISLILLILSLPISLIIMIVIKIDDNGPILYEQERLTIHGKKFKIKKFRSMTINAERNGKAQFATENDSRITRVGKVIRKYRMDEIPQFLNILKGEMSFVGPRPERPEIASEIEKILPEFKYRLKVKAGLTGYAQVYGKYNTKLQDKLLLDILYIEDYSMALDLKIIVLTFKILFLKESTEGVHE